MSIDDIHRSHSIASYIEIAKGGASLITENLAPAEKACCLSLIQEATQKQLLLITGAGPEEFRLFNDLPFFSNSSLVELPAWETLPSENIPPSPDIVGERFKALKTLSETKGKTIVLTTLQGALQKVFQKKSLKGDFLTLTKGMKFLFDALTKELVRLGFEKVSLACEKGEYAIRGNIIDLFPVTSTEPYRIEFWGDEIDTIRVYDPASQKSVRHVESVQLGRAKEDSGETKLVPIFDYLDKNVLVVLDDLEALEDRYASLTSLGATPSHNFLSIDELFQSISRFQTLSFTKTELEKLSEVTYKKEEKPSKYIAEVRFEMFLKSFTAYRWYHPFTSVGNYIQEKCLMDEEPVGEELLNALPQIGHETKILFISNTDSEEAALRQKLIDRNVSLQQCNFSRGYISTGFAIAELSLLIFPITELTGRFKIRRQQQRVSYSHTTFDAFDISPGESVVHYNHGIGKFLGIEKRKNHLGEEQEFFLIEYAESAKLYVPLPQAHLITKYVGAESSVPKLHTLGATRWKRQREHTEKAILGYASDLLKMYAEREFHGGFIFPPDSPDTKAFDEEFPYIETEDQLNAIKAVKADMSSKKAMDRLVCGDVGYGKTEVALRAAFKAVVDGKKQVAILVPTTVLAFQHYENFIDRLASFGVSCAMLSRFQKPKEVKQILEDLRNGTIDVVIGTHRLLQNDVVFKDIGLIIVDEEQRFGVKAKEHLKRIKVGVDCLTLTATPIPRTLYLSIVGARDLSVINTPPQDRLPIKTIIAEPDELTIKTACLRELNRDGQVFYIHNRIETIYEAAARIKKLVPQAHVVIAHGSMDGDEIDSVFHTFKKGDANVLVSTSIVENGIDIPNANTIVIENADRFGISDLYQLRGRVGRWNRRAYAYFLIPKNRTLSEIAKKRIEAIAMAGGYGGGLKVAMRDLEIRGAGDILGIDQSGHVSDVGFHLYCKLLKRTIDSLQGKAPTWTIDTRIETPFSAKLPEEYVNDVMLRMEIYQRLGDALMADEVDAIWKEVIDRFGPAPEQAVWLYHISRLRVFAAQMGCTLIKLQNVSLSYEKKQGSQVISNQVLFPKVKGPKEFEERVREVLGSQGS